MMITIPEEDLKFLNQLKFNSSLEPNFEFLKSCLTWEDEGLEDLMKLSRLGREFLYDLWIVRGFIHRNEKKESWGLDPNYFEQVWNYGLQRVPNWPGFKRMILTETDKKYLENELSRVDEL